MKKWADVWPDRWTVEAIEDRGQYNRALLLRAQVSRPSRPGASDDDCRGRPNPVVSIPEGAERRLFELNEVGRFFLSRVFY